MLTGSALHTLGFVPEEGLVRHAGAACVFGATQFYGPMHAGTGLGWAVVMACVSAFQALSVNAYFFRLFRITCQLKARSRKRFLCH